MNMVQQRMQLLILRGVYMRKWSVYSTNPLILHGIFSGEGKLDGKVDREDIYKLAVGNESLQS
jgi:hypothetical protein